MAIQTVNPGSPPLNAGLASGRKFTVVVPSGASAMVYRTGPDNSPITTPLAGPISQTFGPYIGRQGYSVVALVSACTVEEVSSDSAVDGDGNSGRLIVLKDLAALGSGAPAITSVGASTPAGVTGYGKDDPALDYLGSGPWAALADTAYVRPNPASAFARVTWGAASAMFYLRLTQNNTNVQLRYSENEGRTWMYGGTITTSSAGAREHFQIQFATAKRRMFRLEGFNFAFGGVLITTGEAAPYRLLASIGARGIMLCMGDSYTQTTGAVGPSLTWFNSFAETLGYEPYNEGIGGSDWLTATPNTPVERYNVRQQAVLVRRYLGVDTAVKVAKVTAALGYNGAAPAVPNATVIANGPATTTAIQGWYAACAVKPEFLIGPWTPLGNTANSISQASIIAAAAAGLGIKFVPAAGIITAANSALYGLGDNVHPNPAGHSYIGYQLALVADLMNVA